MPSIIRVFFVAVHATALAMLVGAPWNITPALGLPFPLPLPAMMTYTEYASQLDHPRGLSLIDDLTSVQKPSSEAESVSPLSTLASRQGMTTSSPDNLSQLNNYHDQMKQHAHTMNNLASQASSQGCNSECQQQTLFTLSACQQTLSVLAADKGLANYDRNDEVETLLKAIVDLTKEILKATVQIMRRFPVLGPLLGPIVYEIKCIVVYLLDATENSTDASLNALRPLLENLLVMVKSTLALCLR